MHINTWEAIFSRSPANCGHYDERELPHVNWDWPKGTWFQARRDVVRERRPIQLGNCKESADDLGQRLQSNKVGTFDHL